MDDSDLSNRKIGGLNTQNANQQTSSSNDQALLAPNVTENSTFSRVDPPRVGQTDIAIYIHDLVQPLEQLAVQHQLEVLGLMLTMAREQAADDADLFDDRTKSAAG